MKRKKLLKKAALVISMILMLSVFLAGCGEKPVESADSDDIVVNNTEADVADVINPDIADETTSDEADTNEAADNGITSLELQELLGNGINLGNTMEAWNRGGLGKDSPISSYETCWGQPVTTKEMIDGMKNAGFTTIRIPVAWVQTMDFENKDYTIREDLLSRIEELVGYALDNDMYVIVNDHWDGGWWAMFSADEDEAFNLYTTMWTQISERFKGYSDHLIFEGGNEEVGNRLCDLYPDSQTIVPGAKQLSTDDCYRLANKINQTFVDTVRSTGGNNAYRFLLIPGYDTNIDATCDSRYVMPSDSANDKLLLSVHYYDPSGYCIFDSVASWGDAEDLEEMRASFAKLKKFTDAGYGVIIGEYGVVKESADGGLKENADFYTENLLNNCSINGYCPVLWDCNFVYNRNECKMRFDSMMRLYQKYSYEQESKKDLQTVKADAAKFVEDSIANAPSGFSLSDDEAVAWIMFTSSDWSVQYSVGDTYDPESASANVKATDVSVTGEGTYTVSLDIEGNGASGCTFMALGIANGEKLFEGYTIDITEVKINGETTELSGVPYTTSDDGTCTRVNLYNTWVNEIPTKIRTSGNVSDLSATPVDMSSQDKIKNITVTFDYHK